MSVKKVAVVTGSNKGIGYAIVKGLCEKFDGIVYLTSRNVERGQKAVDELKKLSLNPRFHQLDVDDDGSVEKFREYLTREHGGLDILVNNAAIAFKRAATEPAGEQAEITLKTNYFGLKRVCNALFPILRQNARVVNVSSSAGHLSRIPDAKLRDEFKKSTITVEELDALMNRFIRDAKNNTHVQNGWPNWTYSVSKVGVSVLTFIQQREFDTETPNRNISVNAVHPGYVITDMTSQQGFLTPAQGAFAPLYLALEAQDLKGKYVWFDGKVLPWDSDSTPPQNP